MCTLLATGMPKIFLSYRREDSSGYAGRLYDHLREEFGSDSLFRDVNTLQPGDDFVDAINKMLNVCDVVLVVIGPRWLTVQDANGRPRLENERDPVRVEIETALKRKVLVVPVLFERAVMPRSEELPHTLEGLHRLHAIELSDARWTYDVNRLVETLKRPTGMNETSSTRSENFLATKPVDAPAPSGPMEHLPSAGSDSHRVNEVPGIQLWKRAHEPVDLSTPDNLVGTFLRFAQYLPFSEEDKRQYSWLERGKDRYYAIERLLDEGGFSLAFRGFVCDFQGHPIPDAKPVVIKLPKLAPGHTTRKTSDRLNYIAEQSIIEWDLIRRKLSDCVYANPIFDLGSILIRSPSRSETGPTFTYIYATVQNFLFNALPLRDWLVEQGLRGRVTIEHGREKDWGGIASWSHWLRVASMIARGLADIHERRVVHADIWPPNIFIAKGPNPWPIFIDFGESFLVMPSGEPRTQSNHSYRAPEREHTDSVITEQVDVYSFGKLMLYLAIGAEEIIPPLPNGQRLFGHKRRAWVRKIVFERNHNLVTDHPELLDLIMQCIEVDPVSRPTMLEVYDQLDELSSNGRDARIHLDIAVSRINAIASQLRHDAPNNLFIRLIDRKIIEAERLLKHSPTEMVELTGTRDDLISGLVTLFGELANGDSWTTMTTPIVWQRSALGLDGRYATATIHALRRGAAVQRVYAVSVEELGIEWVDRLIFALESSKLPQLNELASRFISAKNAFTRPTDGKGHRPKSPDYQRYHQQRLTLVLNSLASIIDSWKLDSFLWTGQFKDIRTTPGLFLGLSVVGSQADLHGLRVQNPASLMYLNRESEEHDKWLLVVTDIRGRNEDEPILDRPETEVVGSSHAPQLCRVRVYKSKMGVPNNRIRSLQDLFEKSTNLGNCVKDFATCVSIVEADSPKHHAVP